MLTVRDAKPLFALSVLLVPWGVFAFGSGIGGWGVTFPLVQFLSVGGGSEYITIFELFQISNRANLGSSTNYLLWMIGGVLTGLAALYTLLARYLNGTTRRNEDRAIGAAMVLGGSLFIVSRFLVHEYLLFSGPDAIVWFSVPFGAVYTIFVGAVFYFDKFQLGA